MSTATPVASLVPLRHAAPVSAPLSADIWASLKERGRKASSLLDHLNATVIGQDAALRPIAKCVWAAESGLVNNGRRPKAIFLSLGPTGVGKTQTPREACLHLYGGEPAILSMNEFGEENSSGAFKAALSRKMRDKQHCGRWLVLDEVEKGSRDVIDVLLSVLDEGRMLLSNGEYESFSDVFITLTSNIGSADLYTMTAGGSSIQAMEDFVFAEAAVRLRPELFARVDVQIFYHPLSDDVQRQILRTHLNENILNLSSLLDGAEIHVHRDAEDALIGLGFHNQRQGARRIRSLVRELVTDAVMRACANALSPRPPLELRKLNLTNQRTSLELVSRMAAFGQLGGAALSRKPQPRPVDSVLIPASTPV